jgi:hypothetical protein
MPRCRICRTPHDHLGRRGVMATLAAAPRSVARALGRTSRARLARRPARGEWSATEVLGHLLDAEVTLAFRIRKLAAEPGSLIVAWDQGRWTDGLRHRSLGGARSEPHRADPDGTARLTCDGGAGPFSAGP